MRTEEGKAGLRVHIPAWPAWYRQEHGTHVVEGSHPATVAADASFTKTKDVVCAVMAADCMPVLLAHDEGEVVGVAHAGWRGLAAGVIEAALEAMGVPPGRVIAWLGPAIGPERYEVGEEVRAAYLERDRAAAAAFTPTRSGHWRLDLYAVARQRLAGRGVGRVYGGGFCTFTESERFFSYRRERAAARMAAAIWLS